MATAPIISTPKPSTTTAAATGIAAPLEGQFGILRDAGAVQGQGTRDVVNLQGNATRDAVANQGQATRGAVWDANAQSKGRDAVTQGLVSNNLDAINQGNANTLAGLNKVQTGMNTGFSNVQGNLATGFENVGAGQVAIQDNLQTGFVATNENLGTLGKSVQDWLSEGFNAAKTQLSDVQSGLVSGQQTLGQGIGTNTGKLDAMYSGLSSGQEGLMGAVGDFQGQFGDFNEQYTQDTNVANQTRANLGNQLTGGFGSVQNQAGQIASAQQAGQQRLMQNVGGYAPAPTQAPAQQAPTQNPIQQGVSTVRGLLTNIGGTLDPNTRTQFAAVASSFDENGQFMPQGADSQGNALQRQMDEQGNLITRTINQQGQVVGQFGVNIARVFDQAQSLSNYSAAQSYQANALSSPQNTAAVPQTGFVSPSMTTG